MILIVCVDDDNGMMFNHRRQIQDRVLRERVLGMTAGSRLWMNHYTEKQFATENAPQINVDDGFLNEAAPGDYCFVEGDDVTNYEMDGENNPIQVESQVSATFTSAFRRKPTAGG